MICMPAIAESEQRKFPASCTAEPDERQPGEALCPQRYPVEKLRKVQRRVGSYFWASLYQQRPAPRDGEMFKRQWFSIVQALPSGCRFMRYWDKAGSAGKGAYSAGVLMAVSPDGRYFVVNVVRGQWSAGQREVVILQTAHLDQQRYREVAIWVEQEPGSGGKESAENTVRNLAGFTARAEPVHGDKELRAGPLAAQAEVGNVSLLLGDWNETYLEELVSFPNGTYKDQVDASSGAFNKLAMKQVTAGSSAVVTRKQMENLLG